MRPIGSIGRRTVLLAADFPMSTTVLRLSWRTGLRMTRPGFLVVTAVACLLGLATAASAGQPLDLVNAIATTLLALTAHAALNVLNDYHDALNGADDANDEGLFPFTGGARLIQNGEVSANATRQLAWALLLVVVPAGLLLALRSGEGLLFVGLAGLLLGWAYSAPPLALMSRGFGEATVAATWWLVVVGADYAQQGRFSLLPAAVGVGQALLVANILLINGFPDARADASVHKRTLVVRAGPARAARVYLAGALLAHGGLALFVALGIVPLAALAGLCSLPLSLAAAWLLVRRAERPRELRPAIVLSIQAAVVHGLAMGVSLLAAA